MFCRDINTSTEKGHAVENVSEPCVKIQHFGLEETKPKTSPGITGITSMVGSEWMSLTDPCIIKKCVRVNEEVFIQTRNVSCQLREPSSCPFATEMRCDQRSGCCPSCRCGKDQSIQKKTRLSCTILRSLQSNLHVKHCTGSPIEDVPVLPGKRMMLDECTTCQCNVRQGLYLTYKLMCGKITCEPCPKNYQMEKTSGSCCGKCLPTRCDIQLRDGTILYLKGKVTKIGNTCCETCIEPECRLATGRLEFVKVDNCVNENQLNLHYCEVRSADLEPMKANNFFFFNS
ncbi:hypothetical protein E2320_005922, partial [Naja naja]